MFDQPQQPWLRVLPRHKTRSQGICKGVAKPKILGCIISAYFRMAKLFPGQVVDGSNIRADGTGTHLFTDQGECLFDNFPLYSLFYKNS